MTRDEALYRVKGYLTDIIPVENYSEVEEIIKALKQEPCEDVISRKAAIEEIEFGITYVKTIDKETGEVKELFQEDNNELKKAVERVKALPSEQLRLNDKWIPCSVRPPEIDEEVFVYLFGDSPYLAWYDGHKWQTEDFTVDDDEKPTAWMPLPKPWEGEGDD